MKINILVIDDMEQDATLVRAYLKQASLKNECLHAETLFEGVRICNEKDIDLVLLDLNLPDSKGLRTLSGFLERAPKDVPVIVMTGTADEMTGDQAVKSGAQDYLVKGEFDHKLLSRTIRWGLVRHKFVEELQTSIEELSVVKMRFQQASEMANFGHWEIDIVTNEMTWSDQVFKIMGFMPNYITPSVKDYINYVYPEDREYVQKALEDGIKTGELQKIEYRIRVGTSPICYVANQFQVSYDPSSKRTLLVGVLHDITERKRSEELLAQQKISESNSRMKEEILEDMSFNIRTPLSTIVQLSYTLSSSQLNTEQAESVQALQQSVSDLSLAVNNMLNFSVLLSDKISIEEKQFTIENTLQGLVKMFEIKANKKNINFSANFDKNLPKYIIGDETKINQTLYNILDNAIKYTNTGGNVEFSAQVQLIELGRVTINFNIKDNGQGIAKEKIDELLNPNRLLALNEEEKKKGLGLAIAAKLTQTMNGELSVDSKEGQGSDFKVSIGFQIVDNVVQEVSNEPTAPVNVLLVEDHVLNQIATTRVLTKASKFFSVDIAENGQIGVNKFNTNKYDIILMDLQMPVMNGLEAIAEIRKIDGKIPITALSANTNKVEAEKAFTAGANDYLAKPFDPEELIRKIMVGINKSK